MSRSITCRRGARLPFLLLVLSIAIASTGGCVGQYALVPRDTASAGGAVRWFSPAVNRDRAALDGWRSNVGDPVIPAATSSAVEGTRVTLISWNVAVGDGDIMRLVGGIDRHAPLVLLLQEAYRGGAAVPKSRSALGLARRLGAPRPGRDDVQHVAAVLGLRAYYVPSMRNGPPSVSDEDRGNAILSNLPLTDLTAFELPFERQRRVAVAATVNGRSTAGVPWSVRVVSAHLDNMLGLQRMLASGGEYARARQARGLVQALDGTTPVVLGGDFNTWFGFSDRAYVETARSFPQTALTDRRATFRGLLRLDHLFFRLPSGWRAEFRRGNDRFGSDHYPLIATIEIS